MWFVIFSQLLPRIAGTATVETAYTTAACRRVACITAAALVVVVLGIVENAIIQKHLLLLIFDIFTRTTVIIQALGILLPGITSSINL